MDEALWADLIHNAGVTRCVVSPILQSVDTWLDPNAPLFYPIELPYASPNFPTNTLFPTHYTTPGFSTVSHPLPTTHALPVPGQPSAGSCLLPLIHLTSVPGHNYSSQPHSGPSPYTNLNFPSCSTLHNSQYLCSTFESVLPSHRSNDLDVFTATSHNSPSSSHLPSSTSAGVSSRTSSTVSTNCSMNRVAPAVFSGCKRKRSGKKADPCPGPGQHSSSGTKSSAKTEDQDDRQVFLEAKRQTSRKAAAKKVQAKKDLEMRVERMEAENAEIGQQLDAMKKYNAAR